MSVRDYDFYKNLSEVKLVQSFKSRISKNFKIFLLSQNLRCQKTVTEAKSYGFCAK